MPIIFDNDVANLGSTPGIITDTLANKPASATYGTMFIAIDTGDIQTWNGTAWVALGGGGGTPGIDTVLAQNQILTANRNIDTSSFNFEVYSPTQFIKTGTQTGKIGIFFNTLGTSGNFGLELVDDGNVGEDYIRTYDFNNDTIGFEFNQKNTFCKYGYITGAATAYLEINVGVITSFFNGTQSGFSVQSTGACVFGNTYKLDSNNLFPNSICIGRLESLATDTYLKITNNTLETYYGTFATDLDGIAIDFLTNDYYFGYLKTTTNQDTYIKIEPEKIQAIFNNNTEGIELSFTNGTSKLGYFNTSSNTDTYLKIEPGYLNTIYGGVSPDGLYFDFGNRQYKYGSPSVYLFIDELSSVIETSISGVQGFKLDSTNNLYNFGDWTNINFNTNITIDNGIAAKITLQSDNELYLDDNGTGNMISATASGSSGDHLVININGTQYKIALLNP